MILSIQILLYIRYIAYFEVFPSDFVKLGESSQGLPDKAYVLRLFDSSLNNQSDHSEILKDCEEYCATSQKCWGCILDCNETCHWNAIAASGQQDTINQSVQTEIYQKPGNKR